MKIQIVVIKNTFLDFPQYISFQEELGIMLVQLLGECETAVREVLSLVGGSSGRKKKRLLVNSISITS